MMLSKRTMGLVASVALIMGGLAMGTAGTAAAASTPCGSWDHGDDLTGIFAYTTTSGHLKVEPAAECDDKVAFADSSNLDVFCYTMNYYNNEWLYVHQIYDDMNGWILASDVNYESGSTAPHC